MRPLAASVVVAWVFASCPAIAQQSTGPPEAAPAIDAVSWVRIDGRPVIGLRGIPTYPAQRRVAEVQSRILAVANDPAIAPAAIQVVPRPASADVVAGSRAIVSALEADATAEGIQREVLAEAYARQIRRAIETYRHERSASYLRASGVSAGAATVAFVAALWLVSMLMRRFRRFAEARYKTHVHDVAIQSFRIVNAAQIWSGVTAVLRWSSWLAVGIVTYIYVEYVLSLFPWTREFSQHLLQAVLDPLQTMAGAIWQKLPDVIFIAVLYFIVRYLLRLTRLFFDSVGSGKIAFRNFYPDWAAPTYRGVRVLIVLIAVVIAYPHIPGSQSEAFKGLSILVGLMISIGSSSFVANMIAGYALTYRRAFATGEWIELGGTYGEVMQTRMQVTHLRTPKNEEVIIPNSTILTSPVTNYSKLARERGLILHTSVGIGYETPWRQVEAMLLMAAQRTQHAAREPPPFVLQRNLGNFAVEYELNVYCNDASFRARALSELHRNILDVFNEYGVQIMTPAYETDPKQPKVVGNEHWFSPPAQPPDTGSLIRDLQTGARSHT
ncbi:MAG TPA: mechanosensitive ion channel domain-containing protein [Steroidobacter sp.]|uniref:mechanosensitive ion channel family protein n=1 Tax=Steroidobacter sp. TaxID=1978227 RepID=UPI002EDA9D72